MTCGTSLTAEAAKLNVNRVLSYLVSPLFLPLVCFVHIHLDFHPCFPFTYVTRALPSITVSPCASVVQMPKPGKAAFLGQAPLH